MFVGSINSAPISSLNLSSFSQTTKRFHSLICSPFENSDFWGSFSFSRVSSAVALCCLILSIIFFLIVFLLSIFRFFKSLDLFAESVSDLSDADEFASFLVSTQLGKYNGNRLMISDVSVISKRKSEEDDKEVNSNLFIVVNPELLDKVLENENKRAKD